MIDDSNNKDTESPNSTAGINQLLHDLSQPLTTMQNYAEVGLLIAGKQSDSETMKLRELFHKICEESQRTRAICNAIQENVRAMDVPPDSDHADHDAPSTANVNSSPEPDPKP